MSVFTQKHVSASCHLPLHARNRSLLARASRVISQHVRWPTRTPRPTCANQDAGVVITPKRPEANSIHIAAWYT